MQCWGEDDGLDEKDHGQVTLTPDAAFSILSVGAYHNCALDNVGEVTCWGKDEDGQVSDVPFGRFAALYSGAFHSCALDDAGLLTCWGQDVFGQVSEIPGQSITPTRPPEPASPSDPVCCDEWTR